MSKRESLIAKATRGFYLPHPIPILAFVPYLRLPPALKLMAYESFGPSL